MGSVGKRLLRLEELSRERAIAQLRGAWASLTDEEIALVLAPYSDGRRTPTPEERAVAEKMRAFAPEELIASAIGLTERMGTEEVDRRVSELVQGLGIFERGKGIRRYMRCAREGG